MNFLRIDFKIKNGSKTEYHCFTTKNFTTHLNKEKSIMSLIEKTKLMESTLKLMTRESVEELSKKYSVDRIAVSNIILEVFEHLNGTENISLIKCGFKAADILKEVFPSLKVGVFPELNKLQFILEKECILYED